MGHCVGGGGYCTAVRSGSSVILSLRDKKNEPHVTTELEPTNSGAYNVIQIQGKSNHEPDPQYQKMMKQFFT